MRKDISPPILVTGRFQPFNWKNRLESVFPSRDVSDFVKCARENWKNRERDPRLKNGQFAWFYQVAKMVNWRYREKPLFVRWLMLCIARPKDFLLSWNWTAADFEKALDVLGKAGIDTADVSNKLSYRLKDDCLLRLAIAGILTWGYEDFVSYWKYRQEKGKLCDLLRFRKTVTKRELQRRLRIKADQLEALMDELRKKKLIRERRLPRNSVQITWVRATKQD